MGIYLAHTHFFFIHTHTPRRCPLEKPLEGQLEKPLEGVSGVSASFLLCWISKHARMGLWSDVLTLGTARRDTCRMCFRRVGIDFQRMRSQ